jgi:RHS repeat-associated protein
MTTWIKTVLVLVLGLFASIVFAGTPTVTYIYTDQQGTVVAEADGQGNVTANLDYSPYGSQMLGSPPDGPGYAGHVNDPDTALVYMQARYYDPYTARFLSVDPETPDAGDVFKFGRFVYANNTPFMRVDPDGRDSVGEIIDSNAKEAADQGNGLKTYAWAFAGVSWNFFGAEGTSQVADKGTGAGKGDMGMAALEVVTLGKGNLTIKAAEAEGKPLVKAVVYWFKEAHSQLPYIGQTSNFAKRIAQHIKDKKLLAAELHTVEAVEVSGGKTAREIAEHQKIQEHTGNVPARESGKVANKKDPIGPARQHLLNEAGKE